MANVSARDRVSKTHKKFPILQTFGPLIAVADERGKGDPFMYNPPAILTTCAVLACAWSGLDLSVAPFLLVGERPRQFAATRPKQWKGARECMMAMLVEHGYSVADVAEMLDCSASQVRRACAKLRESPDELEEHVLH